MQLTVPTSFSNELLTLLGDHPVRYLYGPLPDQTGTGAETPDWEQVGEHIRQARSLGIGFLYAFNAACGGNAELTGEGQRSLAERLGRLVEIEADGVVTANPYVMDMVRRRFPELRLHVSNLANVDSVEKALFYQQLGVTAICLPEYVNRDFKLLAALLSHVKGDLVLLANLGCLLHCPIRNYHLNTLSHAGTSLASGSYLDYSLATCTTVRVSRAEELLRAPWIRPEDLSRYEEMGFRHFKIAGSARETQWLLRVVTAYSARSYQGDLNDLVPGWDTVEPFGPLPLRLENALLQGFIEGFERRECRQGCAGCTYCDEWARRAVWVERDPERYVKAIERLLRRFVTGTFRSSLTHP